MRRLLEQAEVARAVVAGTRAGRTPPSTPAKSKRCCDSVPRAALRDTALADATTRDVEMLLSHAQAALASAAAGTSPLPAGVSQFKFENLSAAARRPPKWRRST